MNMENFEDVEFDDEFDEISADSFNDQPAEESNQQPIEEETDDLTNDVLRLKGISDPSKIKFEDDYGNVVEKDWNSLSKSEQLNILADQSVEEDYSLSELEIDLINNIRQSGMSPDQYLQSLMPEMPEKRYDIDDLSDEELYALDLLHKVGSDLSDEEIAEAVESAKRNEKLFNKTIEGLRREYIKMQEDNEEQERVQQEELRQQRYNNFANTIVGQIRNLNSFAGQELHLTDDDVEELSEFMLNLDNRGLSAFGKAMNDPELFTKAAFWILNEDKIIEELNNQIKDNYRRGYEQAKLDMAQPKSKLVFKKPASQNKTADEAFIDDEDWF